MSGFFKGLCKLPFLGRLIQSLNAYVADGEPYALVRFARVKNYLKLLKELCAAFVITLVVYFFFPGLLAQLGPVEWVPKQNAEATSTPQEMRWMPRRRSRMRVSITLP